MQKINYIHYALLILGLSGASLSQSATPEDIAAALNFCQERFNTSDAAECQQHLEKKSLQNSQESFAILFANNFASLTPEEAAKIEEQSAENYILNNHAAALRNDQLTPELGFKCYLKLITRTLERCSQKADATDVPQCLVNGWLDDVKMITNTPDAVKMSKSPLALEAFDTIAAYAQAGLESEISRLEAATRYSPVPVDGLKELLEAIKEARAMFAPVVTSYQMPHAPATTANETQPNETVLPVVNEIPAADAQPQENRD